VIVKIQQTLRNARFIGEMAFKGIEREIRSRLSPPRSEVASNPVVSHQDRESVSEPFDGYGLLTAAQIIEQSKTWTAERKASVTMYESATRNRRSVLQALS
jgi:hypothetical protein